VMAFWVASSRWINQPSWSPGTIDATPELSELSDAGVGREC